MNTIYIEETAYNYLRTWYEQNEKQCKYSQPYFTKCEIRTKTNKDLVAYITPIKDTTNFKYSVKYNKALIMKGAVISTPQGTNDYQIKITGIFPKENLPKEKIEVFAMTLIVSYIHANAFLWYGNFLDKDKREFIANGKNDKDKVIVFRPFKNKLYAASTGKHRSPNGVFEVRGHFRHYKKTNKVIWIDSFMKGTNDKD